LILLSISTEPKIVELGIAVISQKEESEIAITCGSTRHHCGLHLKKPVAAVKSHAVASP